MILQNDFMYFVHLYERVKMHQLYNHPNRQSFIDKEFGQIIRELCLEDFRLTDYRYYPSRQTCLYCIPLEEGIKFWQKELINESKDYQLVELSIKGKTFIGSNDYLDRYVQDIDSYYEYISQYWKNPITRPTKQSEILFEGVAKCIRILKEETVGKSNTWDEMTIRK